MALTVTTSLNSNTNINTKRNPNARCQKRQVRNGTPRYEKVRVRNVLHPLLAIGLLPNPLILFVLP